MGTFLHEGAAQAYAAQLGAEYDVPVLDIRAHGQKVRDTLLARLADDARIRRRDKTGVGAMTCVHCGAKPTVLVPDRADALKKPYWLLCCEAHANDWPRWSHPLARGLPFLPLPALPDTKPEPMTLAEVFAKDDDPDAPPPFSI